MCTTCGGIPYANCALFPDVVIDKVVGGRTRRVVPAVKVDAIALKKAGEKIRAAAIKKRASNADASVSVVYLCI